MSVAYRISKGAVGEIQLPFLPGGMDVPGLEQSIYDGPVDTHFTMHALDLVRDLATLVTPWATWYCAPDWTDRQKLNAGGHAFGHAEIALISTRSEPYWVIQTALHEAWHLVEHLIPDEKLRHLDAVLSSGPSYPDEYYSRNTKRRARAFSNYSMIIIDGVRLHVDPRVQRSPEAELFWYVFTGKFGREVMESRRLTVPQMMRTRLQKLASSFF